MQLSDSIISFHNVSKSFNNKHIIKNLYLNIPINKSLVILGKSGSGKSVLLKCLLGLMQFDSGQIFFAGNKTKGLLLKDKSNIINEIGVVFQSSALFDSMTVYENIIFKIKNTMCYNDARKTAIYYLNEVGIPMRFIDVYPSELSGGMQRRVAIARAIIANPKFLFFDEPTSGLDPIFSSLISDLIKHYIEKLSATAITITHDINSALTIGDNISMLYNGSIVWNGESNELMRTMNPFVYQFVRGKIEGEIPKL